MLDEFIPFENDYQALVSLACYAIEHGFDVRYAGDGILNIQLCSQSDHRK